MISTELLVPLPRRRRAARRARGAPPPARRRRARAARDPRVVVRAFRELLRAAAASSARRTSSRPLRARFRAPPRALRVRPAATRRRGRLPLRVAAAAALRAERARRRRARPVLRRRRAQHGRRRGTTSSFGAFEPGGERGDRQAAGRPLAAGARARSCSASRPSALLLPEALAGVAARRRCCTSSCGALWGRPPALAAAAALAVLPVAVLTARSDTMDSLAVALALLSAVALVARAARRSATPRGRWLLAARAPRSALAFASSSSRR